ncbi:Pentatricopeptide repeat-containing protein, mitochondrial, partial [Cucurbita argyrosperma subsp. argyrosperma]
MDQFFSKALTRYALAGRFYHTNRLKKATLYAKISPLGDPSVSVEPVLDGWVKEGKKVRIAELQRIIHDLRKRKRFTQALEVSEWMKKTGVCIFSPSEHAVQLDLIGRVRGYLSAESYFNQLKEQDQTDKTYGALLNCYVRQRQVEKSLSHLQKMKEMGFATSELTYNDMMCLYTNVGQHDKVPEVLAEMKEKNVSPDNFSYRICINSYGARRDLEGMENVLKEMESQPHIVMDWNTYAVVANFFIKADLADKAVDALKKAEERLKSKDRIGHNHLISLYATLGNKEKVLRLWNLDKTDTTRLINRDYITMLESLVRLGELEEAEKVLKEWESSGNCYDFRVPNTVIVGYIDKGMCERAEALLEDLMEKGKTTTPNSWGAVAVQYMDRSETEKSVECMKAALTLNMDKGWKPNLRVITGILNWLGENGSIEEVEAFVGSLRSVIPVNREMYHALMKAHIRGGKEVHELLNQMKSDKLDEDEETKKILGTGQETTEE